MSYDEVQIYERMEAAARAVQNADSPEKDFRSLNCFGVGAIQELEKDTLGSENASEHFYSRAWEAGGSLETERALDFPLAYVLPPTHQYDDVSDGAVLYRFTGYVLDKWKTARTGSSHADYACRTQEQIWRDCTELARLFLSTTEDRPGLAIIGPVDMSRVQEMGSKRLWGVRFTCTLRAVANYCAAPVYQVCEDVTITVNGGAFTTAEAGETVDVPVQYESGGTEGISVIDGVVVVPDPDACDPASITTNGDSPALEVASGASQDIAIHDTAGADVGTRSGATVTIADGTVTVNGAGSIAAKAEGTTNVNVENSAGADVGSLSGSTVTIGDMTLDYPDGTTEALVLVPGGTVVIDPELIIGLAGTESSYTFTTPGWDTSFSVSAQTVSGGGSISNIVIDGGAPVSTFVGASIPASVVVSFDITGTVTSVKLEF